MPLWSSASALSSSSACVQWHNALSSLLLQELWAMQLERALHGARTAPPVEGAPRQSAAFAMLATASSAAIKGKDKAAQAEATRTHTEPWLAAQTQALASLAPHVAAFASQ